MESLRSRLFVLCLSLILLFAFGCATGGGGITESRIKALEERVDLVEMMAASGVAASFRPFTCLTGGTTGCVDKIDGDSLADGDAAIVALEADGTYGNRFLTYVLDATSSCGSDDAGSPPKYFQPDTNAGTKCWELAGTISLEGNEPMYSFAHTSGNDTLEVYEMLNAYIYMSVTGELELREIGTGTNMVPQGSSFCVQTVGAIAISVDPHANDSMTLEGVEDTNGDKVTNTSTTGDLACFVACAPDGWCIPSNPNSWTAGGA